MSHVAEVLPEGACRMSLKCCQKARRRLQQIHARLATAAFMRDDGCCICKVKPGSDQ